MIPCSQRSNQKRQLVFHLQHEDVVPSIGPGVTGRGRRRPADVDTAAPSASSSCQASPSSSTVVLGRCPASGDEVERTAVQERTRRRLVSLTGPGLGAGVRSAATDRSAAAATSAGEQSTVAAALVLASTAAREPDGQAGDEGDDQGEHDQTRPDGDGDEHLLLAAVDRQAATATATAVAADADPAARRPDGVDESRPRRLGRDGRLYRRACTSKTEEQRDQSVIPVFIEYYDDHIIKEMKNF